MAWVMCSLLALQYAAQPFLTRSFAGDLSTDALVVAGEMLKICLCLVLLGPSNLCGAFRRWTPWMGLRDAATPAVAYAAGQGPMFVAIQNPRSVYKGCPGQAAA
ncbi:unnamed protein product [Effrenium voratum]|nr:unnamed protein product [Effrenium voratum]